MSTVELIGGVIAISLLIAVFYGARVVMIIVLIGAVGYYVINHWNDSTSLTSLPKILGIVLIALLAIKALAMFFGGILPLLLTIGLVTVTGAWLYQSDNKAGGGWTRYIQDESKKLPTVPEIQEKIKSLSPQSCLDGKRIYAKSPVVDMTEGDVGSVLCEGLPTQACMDGCAYQVVTPVCDSTTTTAFGYKENNRYLVYHQSWWVATGNACGG